MKQCHVDESQPAHKEELRRECDQLTKDGHVDVNDVNEGVVD